MRRISTAVAIACVALVGCADKAQQAAAKPQTDDDKALYALGVILSQNVKNFDFTDKELDLVKAGLADGAKDKSQFEPEEMEKMIPKLQELQTKRVASAVEREKTSGAAFLDKAAAEKGATKTASGLVYKEIKAGEGPSPVATDQVKVNYEGKFTDGKVFDSSIKRNEPATFPLNGVIPCWTEAVQLMKVGGKAQVVCPPNLAYGDEGRPPQMRGGATLVFDIDLLEILKDDPAAAAAPAAPAPKGK